MPQDQLAQEPAQADPEELEAAAIYVRVSSTGQLGRDGDEDGYSIPAQVKACEREAHDRGATVARPTLSAPSPPRATTGRSCSR